MCKIIQNSRTAKWLFHRHFYRGQARHNVDIMQLVGGKPPNPWAKKSADFFCPKPTHLCCLRRRFACGKEIILSTFVDGIKKSQPFYTGWD